MVCKKSDERFHFNDWRRKMKFSEIKDIKIERIPSRFYMFDLVFGGSVEIDDDNDEIADLNIGLPRQNVSVWAGEAGAGKSRLAIQVSSHYASLGYRVMYVTTEVTPEVFKRWTNDNITHPDNYFVYDTKSVEEQVKAMEDINPDVVIVDSATMLDGAQNHRNVENIVDAYRDAAADNDCHIALIVQLNDAGEVKGSSSWVFLPDIVCHIKKFDIDKSVVKEETEGMSKEEKDFVMKALKAEKEERKNDFVFSIPDKNRSGPTGREVIFRHTEDGVEEIE